MKEVNSLEKIIVNDNEAGREDVEKTDITDVLLGSKRGYPVEEKGAPKQ